MFKLYSPSTSPSFILSSWADASLTRRLDANYRRNRHGSGTAANRLCSVLQSPLEEARTRSGLGAVLWRVGAVSCGIAYIDLNGFYYFRLPVRCRAGSGGNWPLHCTNSPLLRVSTWGFDWWNWTTVVLSIFVSNHEPSRPRISDMPPGFG